MIRSGFRYCLAIGENFGVRPQVSHTVALTPPVQASRLAAFANEVFETWTAPSFSPPRHQERIAATRPSATKLKFDVDLILFVMRVAAEDGSGLMERSEKPGSDPIFGDGISPARDGNRSQGRNEQRRKSMSHARSFPTSERESVIISPKPLPRTGASLQDSAASDMAALDDDCENGHIRRVHTWYPRRLSKILRTVLLKLLPAFKSHGFTRIIVKPLRNANRLV